MAALSERIREERDLPAEFLAEWKSFLDRYGFDGQDQLFLSCPRYRDSPERLLEMMRMNASPTARDPYVVAQELLAKRRTVMAKQEQNAVQELEACSPFFAWTRRKLKQKLAAVKHRNMVLDYFMRTRNSPKLHLTKLAGTIRWMVLQVEERLLAEGRLHKKGDIFHLTMDEIDEELAGLSKGNIRGNDAVNPLELVKSRKPVYEAAVASNMCPIMVDSRCRILKPDPPTSSEDGVLVGSAISPGVATGKVRIIKDLSPENTQNFGVDPATGASEDHVLVTVVTGPAWTPLFASASAIVLQIGGVLQHGALCAREFGKPAVSSIDIGLLKDGMTVSVDGSTGTVTILEE
jgi:pyruvate,water dikinase